MRATTTDVLPRHWTAANLHAHLGHIPLRRIRLSLPPGWATLEDVLTVQGASTFTYDWVKRQPLHGLSPGFLLRDRLND